MRNLRDFGRYLLPHKKRLCVSVACVFAAVCFDVAGPYVLGHVIDDFQRETTMLRMTGYGLVILGLGLVSALLQFTQRYYSIGLSSRLQYDLRRDFYEHLQRQPASFFQANRTGDLMTRATADISGATQLAGPVFQDGLRMALVIVVVLPLMFRLHARLTLLLLVVMPLVTLTVKFFGHFIQTRFEKLQAFFSRIVACAQENLSGVRLIRAYGQEEAESAAFRELNEQYVRLSLGLMRASAVMSPLIELLLALGLVLVIWYGGTLVVRGEMSVGEFTTFNLYVVRLAWPLIAVGRFVNALQGGLNSLRRLHAVLSVEPAIADRPGVREQPPVAGRIELRGLTFRYEGRSEPALREINLTVEAGQTVAFVGRTGSGKSTLLNLIPRRLEAERGELLIDGVAVCDYPLAQLRASIGYVQQEDFLFSRTIAENIALGLKDADLSRVERAAEEAGLGDDLRDFPNGLATQVGERGVRLSGGQKQRTALARALARRPKILLLDDALSAVDAYTADEILANLRAAARECTTLVVTNRLSVLGDVDLICLMEDGRIAERGTHDELLALGGAYARLYRGQTREPEPKAALTPQGRYA